MQDHIGHNHRTALTVDLAGAESSLVLAEAAFRRAETELERTCWQDDPHAPLDRARAAREFLRAAHARRMRLRDEMAEYDELIDDGDCDDRAA